MNSEKGTRNFDCRSDVYTGVWLRVDTQLSDEYINKYNECENKFLFSWFYKL